MSQPSLSKLATLKTVYDKDKLGKIQRLFRVTCAICQVARTEEADSFEGFCKLLESTFHLSSVNGWVHHSCQSSLPLVIKTSR